jgi:hypothetical protein
MCTGETNTPLANPYWWQYLFVLVLLLAATALWRRVRPKPTPMLRFLAGAAAFIAAAMTFLQASFVMSLQNCRFVVEACAFVASMLLAELAYTLRHPRSIARALRRRRRIGAQLQR